MTQGDKELLLKDLCARLPYGVKIKLIRWNIDEGLYINTTLEPDDIERLLNDEDNDEDGDTEIKPYLFPLSSMTEEMLEKLNVNGLFKYRDTIANVSHLESKNGISEEIYAYIDIESISMLIEFFHSHHIDYRGLIEKGLAIDATGLNIY